MRVVIAGGSGLVGRHLSRALHESGWSVDVLTRDPRRALRQLPPAVRLVRWDGSDSPDVRATIDGADAVVNLAGESLGPRPWTPGRKRALRDSRLRATNALVTAIAALPQDRRPRVLVNASGTDVYTGSDAQPADEFTPPAQEFLAQLCVEWEAAARRAEALGVRVAILRQAFVVAPDAAVLQLLALPFRLFAGGRLGSGRQWFSWIHVDDVVELYRFAICDPSITGVLNATSPEPVQQRDLARALGRVLHRPAWLPVPAWAIRLALWGQATLVLGSRRVVPGRAEAAGYVFRYADLDQALADAL